jgi:hypothetical protein
MNKYTDLGQEGVDGRIVLKWTLKKYGLGILPAFHCLKAGPVACTCEHSNEPESSMKSGEFFGYLNDCQLLKDNSTPCY